MPGTLPHTIQQSLLALRRRELALPALLFVAGHRPLAFAAGQTLAVAAPVAALLDVTAVSEWATLLSAPEGADALHAALLRIADEAPEAP